MILTFTNIQDLGIWADTKGITYGLVDSLVVIMLTLYPDVLRSNRAEVCLQIF